MKKTLLFCVTILACLAALNAAETRQALTLPATGLTSMVIDCGAGYLKVRGQEGLERIEVSAVLHVRGIGEDGLQEFREENVVLKLEKSGTKAVLTAKIDEEFSLEKLFGAREAYIDLDVSLPRGLALVIDDGSGDLVVRDMAGGLEIDDGSGDVSLVGIAGAVKIDDGSGDLSLARIEGDIDIEDGSGDIELKEAGGRVAIDDGSGQLDVRSVQGPVTVDDGSGDIVIDGVEKDVTIDEAGSGGVEIRNVKGKVRK